MRIKGAGFGFSGSGGGSRSDSFKQGRRPGQTVKGTLLKWVSDDTGWVVIEGHKLLAQLHTRPPVGAKLIFVIKQLHPDIILKELHGGAEGGASPLGMASDFEASRTLFENQLRSHAAKLEATSYTERQKAFIDLLSTDKKLLNTFLDSTACIQAMNQQLQTETIGYLYYAPWFVPTGRRHIGRFRPSSGQSALTESFFECDLQPFGMIRLEFLFKESEGGYKLKIQNSGTAHILKKLFSSRKSTTLPDNLRCLGIAPLPQNAHGGILAETLFSQKA